MARFRVVIIVYTSPYALLLGVQVDQMEHHVWVHAYYEVDIDDFYVIYMLVSIVYGGTGCVVLRAYFRVISGC